MYFTVRKSKDCEIINHFELHVFYFQKQRIFGFVSSSWEMSLYYNKHHPPSRKNSWFLSVHSWFFYVGGCCCECHFYSDVGLKARAASFLAALSWALTNTEILFMPVCKNLNFLRWKFFLIRSKLKADNDNVKGFISQWIFISNDWFGFVNYTLWIFI